MRSLVTSTRLKLVYVAIAAADSWLSGSANPRHHRARVLTKPLLMPTLMASLVTDPRAAGSPLRTSTLIAQAGGWGGDLALMGDGAQSFIAGSSSFGVGHAAYIGGFLANRSKARRPGPKAVAALWATTAPVMVLGAARQDKRLGPTIAIYSAMLASAVAASTQLESPTRSAQRATVAGAGLFMLSDSILGARMFLLKNPPHRIESAVMATYTAAQFLLSEGAARAGTAQVLSDHDR